MKSLAETNKPYGYVEEDGKPPMRAVGCDARCRAEDLLPQRRGLKDELHFKASDRGRAQGRAQGPLVIAVV